MPGESGQQKPIQILERRDFLHGNWKVQNTEKCPLLPDKDDFASKNFKKVMKKGCIPFVEVVSSVRKDRGQPGSQWNQAKTHVFPFYALYAEPIDHIFSGAGSLPPRQGSQTLRGPPGAFSFYGLHKDTVKKYPGAEKFA